MKRCRICVTPEGFPHVRFDSKGACSLCAARRPAAKEKALKKQYRQKFEALLSATSRARRKGPYDILACFSGGKDSAYALSVLRERYGLRVLAFTLDNGFVPPRTMANIRSVVEKLGVDHILFKPRFGLLKKIFRFAMARPGEYPAKSIERASAVCFSCMGFIKYTALKLAIEKDIPMIGYGWSPGQAPVTSSILRLEPAMVRKMEAVSRKVIEKAAGCSLDEYFLEERHYAKKGPFPVMVHPLAFFDYDLKKLRRRIGRLGWRQPRGVDINASNCFLNSLANDAHIRRYGMRSHPYICEAAELVRSGYISRADGLKMVSSAGPAGTIAAARKKLGM